MRNIFKIFLLVFIAFETIGQTTKFEISNICPTQTATPINSVFIFPFKVKVKITKKVRGEGGREHYTYHLFPKSKLYKNFKLQVYGIHLNDTDESIIDLYKFIGYLPVPDYKNLLYNETHLISWNSFEYFNHKYTFFISVNHNQTLERFDLNKIIWFTDTAKNWHLYHRLHIH
ncbi:hypothetical protein D0T08_24710 [Emticicia sp. C21]|nr:hypothetical protein D0T08_24710 [Emticicia sp. C21]